MSRKRIAIVATGGTIAGAGEVGKSLEYRAGEISVSDIIESIPNINDLAVLECHALFSLDSNEMDPDKWLLLAGTINDLLDRDDIDGCVVTHGTDTLDETSYFLNLTVSSVKPVVLTGAMRPATATSADGPFNLYQSVALAACEQAMGKGVMALFSSTIYSGRDIEKINNFRVDAFNHKDFGCLGFMQDERVYFYSRVYRKHTYESVFSRELPGNLPKVAVVSFYAGADPS
ncbi:MAG: asparaginase, partial [Eubacteriaceae bacterium]|nr:asparaginase [Eubacteriaceae bacterium]